MNGPGAMKIWGFAHAQVEVLLRAAQKADCCDQVRQYARLEGGLVVLLDLARILIQSLEHIHLHQDAAAAVNITAQLEKLQSAFEALKPEPLPGGGCN